MKAMRIKEVADRLNISARTIRFYEEKGLVAPAKSAGSQYRTYTESEVWRLQAILSLREIGMSIDEIKLAMSEMDKGNHGEIRYYLEQQRASMYTQWLELKQMIATADHTIDLLNQNQPIVWEDIHHLAESSKRLRELRHNWQDRWNFDRLAVSYDIHISNDQESFNPHQDYDAALDLTVKRVAPKASEVGLDIGTGTGNLAQRFLQQGIRICGIDQSKEMLKQCMRKNPKMETKLGNFLAIPYGDSQFDFVVTSYAFHHLTDKQKPLALEEICRVLKPEGRFCITDLMFENEQMRKIYMDRLQEKGHQEAITAIEDEYYTDRSWLEEWFQQHGYAVRSVQINELLHLVCAYPAR